MSEDFDTFDYLFDEYNNTETNNLKPIKCCHKNIITEKDTELCVDCGEEICKNIIHEKEWRYYGNTDTKNTTDPNRVQIRKNDDRNIYNDVDGKGFSDKVIAKANEIYLQVTKGQIKRGNSRKAIIFACVFQAYKLLGIPQTHDRLIEVFDLDRRSGLRGLKHVALNSPKNSDIHTTHITPIHLIKEIMEKFDANSVQINEVIELYNKIKNKDTKINRSRPQSVAAGITYYWICNKHKGITLKEFTKKSSLSELTIGKMAKIVSDILEEDKDTIKL